MIAVICTTLMILMLGLTLADVAMRDFNSSVESYQREQAREAADAGIDYVCWQLQIDGAGPQTRFWTAPGTTYNGQFNGTAGSKWSAFVVQDATGRFPGNVDISSSGTVGPETVRVHAVVPLFSTSPWNNAIFCGTGQSGGTIHGHCTIVGSIHCLGTGLSSTSQTISFGGGASLLNNYDDGNIPAAFSVRVPPLPIVNGLSTINAIVRVKHGQVDLSGGSQIGNPSPAAGDKGPVDASYVTDGYTSGSISSLYSTLPNANYDLTNTTFFSMLDPITVINPTTGSPQTWNTRLDYYADPTVAYQYTTGDLNITSSSFGTVSNPTIYGSTSGVSPNYIELYQDSSGNDVIQLSGIVHVANGAVNIGGHKDNFFFVGRGTIVAGGSVSNGAIVNAKNITADGNLLSYTNYANGAGGFPLHDNIGLVAPGSMSIGPSAQSSLMGTFYAQGNIDIGKQTNVAGALVSTTYSMSNPPSLYQVPTVATHLPPGIPGSEAPYYLSPKTTRLAQYYVE